MRKLAIVCARGLGDGLLSLILSNNFSLSGYRVTTFSNALFDLRSWFPSLHILPLPHPPEEILFCFDRVIAADHSPLSHFTSTSLTVLREKEFDKKRTMVENLQLTCEKRFSLPFHSKDNGIQPPADLKKGHFEKRVILHPLSFDEKKNWPAKKYIDLALELHRRGYSPSLCMSPQESKGWRMWMEKYPQISFPLFPNLSDLAGYIYESGGFIGNDSGLGHLASNLGIPTLSLFSRRSYSHLWRPGWAHGTVVTPLKILPGSRLMNRYWKTLLSKRRVLGAFQKDLKAM